MAYRATAADVSWRSQVVLYCEHGGICDSAVRQETMARPSPPGVHRLGDVRGTNSEGGRRSVVCRGSIHLITTGGATKERVSSFDVEACATGLVATIWGETTIEMTYRVRQVQGSR